MTRRRCGALGALLVLLAQSTSAHADEKLVIAEAKRSSVTATIDMAIDESGSIESAALLREVRTFVVPPGHTTVEWTGLAHAALVDTIDVALATPSPSVRLTARRIDDPTFTSAGIDAALKGTPFSGTYVAKTGSQARAHHEARGGRSRKLTGTIVALAGGTVLRVDGELMAIPSDGPSFRVQSSAELPVPRLFIELQNDAKEPQTISLAMTGVTTRVHLHEPRYKMLIDSATGKARLSGTILVVNQSGLNLNGGSFSLGPSWELHGSTPRRGRGAKTELAETWAKPQREAMTGPFPLVSKGAFDASGLSELTIIEGAEVTPSMTRSVQAPPLSSLSEQMEKDATVTLPAASTWKFDTAPLKLASALPSGSVRVSDTSGPSGSLLAEGTLRAYSTKPVQVAARVREDSVTARQVSRMKVSDCVSNTVWRFEYRTELLHTAPLEIVFPFDKKTFMATLADKDGATLKSGKDETVVTLPKTSGAAPVAATPAEKSVTLRIRTNTCL